MRILITGSSSGIGFLTAKTLAYKGHTIFLSCHRQSEIRYVKEKVKDYKNIIVIKLDVTNLNDRKKALDLDLDCIICNAAVAQGGSFLEIDMEKVRENFEVNVFSNFQLVKNILKQMISKDKGRIVIISSLAANVPILFASSYSASKASVSSITKALKKEVSLINKNVKIALVEPGLYHTGFNNVFLDNKYDDGIYFRKLKDKIYKLENLFLKLFEKKDLDSIVIQIVRAATDKRVKKVYRAPFFQSLASKLYSLFK